jgi:hypothetical protein
MRQGTSVKSKEIGYFPRLREIVKASGIEVPDLAVASNLAPKAVRRLIRGEPHSLRTSVAKVVGALNSPAIRQAHPDLGKFSKDGLKLEMECSPGPEGGWG